MEAWKKPETVALWIVIAIFFVALLTTSIVVLSRSIIKKTAKTRIAESRVKFEHEQELLKTNIWIQEEERKRIAADIHDILIGKLTVLHMKNAIENKDRELNAMLKESIDIARRISHDLSPPLLEFTPLHILIQDILDPWKQMISVSHTSDIRNHCAHSDDIKIQLTRVIQEVMTNITKHANATQVKVHFRQTDHWIALQVQDNGQGFNPEHRKKGIGLKNIETRMQYLHGHYHFKSILNKGTSILFLLNLPNFESQ